MKITRDNYQLWFVDWLDNNLPASTTQEMNAFLDQNPDLLEGFSDITLFKLKPNDIQFNKESLKRSPGQVPVEQFELICAAYAENDLNEEQIAEMYEMVGTDQSRARVPLIYSRIRLTAPEVVYKGKPGLKKHRISAKFFSIAAAALSAAAVLAFIVLIKIPDQDNENIKTIGLDTQRREPVSVEVNKSEHLSVEVKTGASEESGTRERKAQPVLTERKGNDLENIQEMKVDVPDKIYYSKQISLVNNRAEYSIAASTIEIKEQGFDERSRIGAFIARNFRTKILDEPLPSDSPLRGYEIAEAGIEGINKLLGWEMALTRKSDDNGEVRSLNFDSRMLKFNTPVKNNGYTE
jgi:hypothetical protein